MKNNNHKLELLSDLCHEQWSGWMKYLFARSYRFLGWVVIPRWAVERWDRQMSTPYWQLSKKEKASDEREAERFLKIIITERRQLINEVTDIITCERAGANSHKEEMISIMDDLRSFCGMTGSVSKDRGKGV